MIRAAEFRNFKGLRDVRLDFERFTVLVGPNASGKTSILQGLHLLSQVRDKAPATLFQGEWNPARLLSHEARGVMELAAWTEAGGCKLRVIPKADAAEGNGETPSEKAAAWNYVLVKSESMAAADWNGLEDMAIWRSRLPAATLLRLDTRCLAAPSFSEASKPKVGEDGVGLASSLAYLALNQPDEFTRVKDLVHRIFPFLTGIRFGRVEIQHPRGPRWGEQILFDLQGASGIPAHLASDGLLLVLGLVTVIRGAEQRHLLLLDDLDHGLHPLAQEELVDLLRKLLDEKPELQIVATTHSPYLLDRLRPEEVRLTTRTDDGVLCGRLDAHPEFERWKGAMLPGEFWSMVGEKWIASGRLQESPA
jgi:predicted ATPase